MKISKLSLENIKGKLSRSEMKNIMAGSGTDPMSDCYCGQTRCVKANRSGLLTTGTCQSIMNVCLCIISE
jgi:hypothetical protein